MNNQPEENSSQKPKSAIEEAFQATQETSNKGNGLFGEFDAVSEKAFKQQIQYDLKGAEYNESLVWKSPEGIHVKPFYHRESTSVTSTPGQPQSWQIAEEIYVLDVSQTVRTAQETLQKGAESLVFKADAPFDSQKLLSELPSESFSLYFNLSFFDADFTLSLCENLKTHRPKCHLNLDPVGQLAFTGNWFSDRKTDFKNLERLFLNTSHDNVIGIDTMGYHNAGATGVQQLAYALSHANEYLNHFGDQLKNQTLTFKVACGSNYFFEIAKIRALRLLYASLAAEYDLPETCHILAVPALRNKTLYDYNTNLLRTTTEAMSAILGGADTVCNLAYDAIYHKTNDFGQRIARNQLLILKHESYLDQVTNPAEGTYYVESITAQMAEQALALFKELEAGGGFVTQLIEGKIQNKIKETAAKEQERFDVGEKILVGTNKYQNPDDRMKDELELYPFLKVKPRKTLIEPIIVRRLSEELEQKRLKDE